MDRSKENRWEISEKTMREELNVLSIFIQRLETEKAETWFRFQGNILLVGSMNR